MSEFPATLTAVVVRPDETVEKIEMDYTLEAMQSIVDGYIEPVFGPDFTVYVNEEGSFIGLPMNTRISEIVGQPLMGTALILGPPDPTGLDTNVVDRIVHHYNLEK